MFSLLFGYNCSFLLKGNLKIKDVLGNGIKFLQCQNNRNHSSGNLYSFTNHCPHHYSSDMAPKHLK